MSKRSRKPTPLARVMDLWGNDALRRFAALDDVIRGRRGPKGYATCAGLFCVAAALMRQGRRYFLADIAEYIQDEIDPSMQRKLGLHHVPSLSSLRRLLDRLERFCREGDGHELEFRLQRIMNAITRGSAPPPPPGWDGFVATDSKLFDAWCRSISRKQWDLGERASDRDAGPRTIDRGSGLEHYFGYQATTKQRATRGQLEYIDAVAISSANDYDVPAAARLTAYLAETGFPETHEFIDRGFSADGSYLALLRSHGIHPHYDLKTTHGGPEGDHACGCPIVDGWVYADTLPASHRRRKVNGELGPWRRPDKRAPRKAHDEWREHLRILDKHAFRVHGRPEAGRVRAQHPFARKLIVCEQRPESFAWFKEGMPICKGGHAPGTGCFVNTIWITAKDSPYTFQVPHYGSKERDVLYNSRSAVERGNGALDDEAKVHFKAGMFRVRGIVRVGIFLALAVVTHNLLLTEPPRGRRRPSASG